VTVTAQGVREAATTIAGAVAETPCLHSRTLSHLTGAEVWLKFENLQFTASFKERGALNKLAALAPAERAAGVLAVSAGNHAQAVAFHARRLGIKAVIVMPRFTPHVKVMHTRDHGADVHLEGETFDEAKAAGLTLAKARGLTLVHPYDDERVICGQGTVALEMLAAQPRLEALVVPVGGGGLIAGMAVAAKDLAPGIEVFGVETSGFPAMRCALHGTAATFASSTIAEGIAVKEPGALTLPIVRALARDVLLVDDGDIEQAIVMLLEIEKTVVEGAGAAGLAALLAHPDRFRGRRVGVVLSGGNIDPLVLSDIIERGMARSGRLARLKVELRDLPGALAKVTACIAAANANIEEVHHQRAFTHLPVLSAEVEFVLQTRGPEHVAEVVAALARAGFKAVVVAD
jgi:threonine dehydratase